MQHLIHTPTPNLKESLHFYKQLGFTLLEQDEHRAIVADKHLAVEINANRFARAGIKLFGANWNAKAAELAQLGPLIETEEGFLVSDQSGCWVYLVESSQAPSLKTANLPESHLGSYAGLSLEVISIQQALQLWLSLGFEKTMGSEEAGWLGMSHASGLDLSLMKPEACPHLFFIPSLSFFNGNGNLQIIQKIRDLEIPITEEITHFNKDGEVDNIIVRDPGGFGFFLFND